MAPPDVSVILPTFNERDTIVPVLEGALETLTLEGYTAEAIVVDDDSPDGTGHYVRDLFADVDDVEVVIRTDASGLSSAVVEGLRRSRGRYAVVMDADGQHPTGRIPWLLESLAIADVVVGSRHVAGGSIEGWPLSRRVTSRVAAGLARAVVPSARELTDPMSGYFAVDRQVVDDEVLDAADPHGYKILLELLTHIDDIDVAEVGITFRERQAGESKMTVDEVVRFGEHVGTLGLVERDLDDIVNPPRFVRALEFGTISGTALFALLLGLVLGDVDGAGGAALIAVAGGLWVLGVSRLIRTAETWTDTVERYAKG